METAIKTLETSLAERNAAIRILQSKNSATHNMSVNNIDEILAARMGVAVAGTPVTPSQAHAVAAHAAAASAGDNILNIPILNSQTSPHKKQFSMPSVLATPPQYHSLNLSKKLGHAQHRSLTPSADMFLRGSAGSQQQQTQHSATEYIRSATPSADILRAAPTAEHMARATPSSSNADIIRTAEILRATPTSAELHRLSAPADMLRGAPIEMLRSTPTHEMIRSTPTHEMIRATPTHEIFRGGNPTQTTAVSMATANEMLRQQQLTDHMIRATPTGTTPNIVASGTGVEPTHKRREPSGTSTGDSFQHPGPT